MKLSLENWKTFLGPGSIFAEWIKFFAGILSSIVLIGEIGGTAEEDAAAFIKVYTYISYKLLQIEQDIVSYEH